jgi:hypothetical protein
MGLAVDKLKQVCDFVNDSITSDKKMKEFYQETAKKMKQIKDLLIPSRKFIHMVCIYFFSFTLDSLLIFLGISFV